MCWDLGFTASYYKTTKEELLQDNFKAKDLNLLTINGEYNLKKEIPKYKQKSQEYD